MQIVRFTNQNTTNHRFQEQKVSLSKLSQIKTHNHQHNQHKIINNQYSNELMYQNPNHDKQSHIVWVQETNNHQQTSQPKIIIHGVNNNKNIVSPSLLSPKRTMRKKIFQQSSKQNIDIIPTFSQIPSQMNINLSKIDETQYYSYRISPSKNNINIEDNEQYKSPFKINQQNSRYQSSRCYGNSVTTNLIDKTLNEVTEIQLPRLQEKLIKHDKQLERLKKYLITVEKYKTLNQTMTQYYHVKEVLNKQEEQEKVRRDQIKLEIERLKGMRLEKSKEKEQQNQKEYDSKISKIERQRVERLNKIQLENQELYCKLQYSKSRLSQDDDYENVQDNFSSSRQWIASPGRSHAGHNKTNHQYRNSMDFKDFKDFKQYRSSSSSRQQLQISPLMLRKGMNEISSIGFTNNHRQQFSIEANTFREIMSPLELQGECNTLDSW